MSTFCNAKNYIVYTILESWLCRCRFSCKTWNQRTASNSSPGFFRSKNYGVHEYSKDYVNACYSISAVISSIFGRLLQVLTEPLLIVFFFYECPPIRWSFKGTVPWHSSCGLLWENKMCIVNKFTDLPRRYCQLLIGETLRTRNIIIFLCVGAGHYDYWFCFTWRHPQRPCKFL